MAVIAFLLALSALGVALFTHDYHWMFALAGLAMVVGGVHAATRQKRK